MNFFAVIPSTKTGFWRAIQNWILQDCMKGKGGLPSIINERIEILKRYLPGRVLSDASNYRRMEAKAGKIHSNPSSIVNAVCLALTAALFAEGLCETIPANPDMDDEGLYMKVVAPRKGLKI